MTTYQTAFRLDQWPILSIHFVIETASVAQIVASAVASPQRRRCCTTIDALTTLCKGE